MQADSRAGGDSRKGPDGGRLTGYGKSITGCLFVKQIAHMAKPVPLKDVIERQKVAPPGQVDETYAVAMLVRRVLMVLRDKGKEKILEKQRYRRGKMRVPTDDTDETDVIFKRGRGGLF